MKIYDDPGPKHWITEAILVIIGFMAILAFAILVVKGCEKNKVYTEKPVYASTNFSRFGNKI
jgi:hypothetical protein